MARWSNIRTLDEGVPWGLSPTHASLLRSVRNQVKSRCDAEMFIDIHRKYLCFGYASEDGPRIVFDMPMYRDPDGQLPMKFCPIQDGTHVDDVVRAIRYARMPYEVKKAWHDQRVASEKREAEEKSKVERQERIKESIKVTDHLYDKHSMGKHYRKSVVMS